MRIGGLGGDWGYLALWSSTLLQIEHTVSSHQDEMRWKRFSTPPRSSEARPGLATFFTFILIKLLAKLAEIPTPASSLELQDPPEEMHQKN